MADLAFDIWLRGHDQYSGPFAQLSSAMDMLGRMTASNAAATHQSSTALAEEEAALGKTSQGAGRLRGSLRAATQAVGALALSFGALATDFLAHSVKDAADFEAKTQALANNTNMGAKGLAAMRENALKLQAATGQDAEKIADGYMHIANHAYSGAAAMNIATAATKNAAATHGDAAEDANVLAGILREMNVSQTDLARNTELATRTMDVLHNAVANSNWTMKQFAEGSKTAFAQAGLYGVPISQVSAQLAVLSEHGFPDAHKASANWAGMLRSLEFPTNKALKGMQSLSRVTGVDLVADIGKLRKDGAYLPQFLADIQKAASSPAAIKAYGSEAAALHAIMSQSSYRAALEALTRNRDEYLKVSSVTGAAQAGKTMPGMVGTNEAFAAQQKTLQGQMDDLKGSVKSTSITIGMALIPVLEKVLRAIMPIIQQTAAWISHHQKLSAQILVATAVLGTFVGSLLLLGPVLGAVHAATTLWTAAQWLLNAALDANPIGLLVIGIAAAVAAAYLLVTHWRQVSAFLSTIWSGIVDAAGQLWQWLTGIWNGVVGDAQLIWEQLGEWLSGIWNGIVSFATGIWGHIVTFFGGLWDGIVSIWQGFWNTIGTWLHNAWDGISGAATTVWNGVTGFLGGLWDGISSLWQGTWNTISTVAHGLWTTISTDAQNVWTTAVGIVKGLWDAVGGLWGSTWDNVKTNVHDKWTAVTNLVHTVWDDAVSTVKGLWDTVSGVWGTVWDTVKTTVHAKWTAVTGEAHKVWDKVAGPVKKLWDGVQGAWTKAWDGISGFFKKLDIGKGAKNVWTTAKGDVEKLWDHVSAAWTTAWNGIKAAFQGAWNGIKTWAQHFWDSEVAGVKNIWGGVKTAWTTAWNAIKGVLDIAGWMNTHLIQPALKWGGAMIDNLKKGIGDKAHELYAKVKEILGPIAKLLPSSPAKEGPLSVPPDFTYIAHAMQAAIPHVHAAGRQLMGAAGLGGGSLGLDVGASGGIAGAAAATAMNASHSVTIAPTINISGGTFTDKQGIRDLAHAVSEEIMHSVRMQGGLLPQM